MYSKNTIWIKKEETNGVSAMLRSVDHVYSSSKEVKEELQELVHQEIVEDPLAVTMPTNNVKEDPELTCEVDAPEQNIVEDPLAITVLNESVKEELGLKREVDAGEHQILGDPLAITTSHYCVKEDGEQKWEEDAPDQNFLEDALLNWEPNNIKEEPELDLTMNIAECSEEASTRSAQDSTRLIKIVSEVCNISFEEMLLRGVNYNGPRSAAGKSKDFDGSGSQTLGCILQEHNSFYAPSIRYNLRENEFRDFTCSVCQQRFLSKYSLIMHVFTHINGVQPPSHICRLCGEVFLTNVSFSEHLRINEGSKTENCHNTKSLMRTAEIMHKGNTCGKSLPSAGILKFHAAQPKKDRLHKCDVCDKSFKGTNFYNHVRRHTSKRPHKCAVCNKTFFTASDLRRHKSVHTGERPYRCDICNKAVSNIKNHRALHTGERPHKCGFCNKSFIVAATLRNHLAIHTGQKPYKCDICKKTFTVAANLRYHLGEHTGEKPHKCDICNKAFTRRGSLKTHAAIHTGLRPYNCEVCNKTFTYANSLKKHTTTHIGERPHKCNFCNKCYPVASALKIHLAVHTQKRPYKCNVCNRYFVRPDNLRKHADTCW